MLVAKAYPGDIFAQRRMAAGQAPRRDYKRILDVGASSGHYTLALAETFPKSEIWGIDLSPRMLEHARRVANERGWAWNLSVRAGEDTKLPAESFDFVTSFILFHEIPPRIIRGILEEAFRLLEPGGDLVMTDVPRYQDLNKFDVWRYDWLAKWGGEPYWRSSATMDLIETAKEIGFEAVEGFTQPPVHTYYVLRARKPR
jgi:ubiquinone/menaquinone biosynthesis C-methylase UbiE